MAEYDVIQVEDYRKERERMGRYLEEQGLSYLGVSHLRALKKALPINVGRIFVVDGNFPKEEFGEIEFLAPQAIEAIRIVHPDARVVLYSSVPNLDEIARQNGAEPRDKGSFTTGEFVGELVKMLDEGEGD